MIAIMVGPTREATLKSSLYWQTIDPEANSEVLILDETTHPGRHSSASMFELGALIYDDVSGVHLPSNTDS